MNSKLDNFYRTRADFHDWMTEKEWNQKEIEIIKESFEPQISQQMKSLLQGINCSLSICVEYSEDGSVSVKLARKGEKEENEGETDGKTATNIDSTHEKGKRQMFLLDGRGPLNKRNCVWETICKYMKQNPATTLQQLQQKFPSYIQGSYGVVRSIQWVQQQQQAGKDFMSRFFVSSDKVINTSDGEQIVVCNQWGNNFSRFVRTAKDLGFDIVETHC